MRRILSIFAILATAVLVSCSVAVPSGKHHYSIMAMGDSITQGGGKVTSYIYPLWKDLTAAGYDFEFVGPRTRTYDVGPLNHCGFGGKTVEYLDEKFDKLYLPSHADVVLLHAGHNHFVEKNPVEGMIKAHKSLIDKILAANPDAYIFVAQVIPSGKLPKYSYIPDFNKEIKKLVRSYHSDHVVCVNVAKGFDWHIYTIDDHVHPNAEGAELMARQWLKSIKRHLRV